MRKLLFKLSCFVAIITATTSGVAAAEIEWRDGYEDNNDLGAGIYLTGEIKPGDFEKIKKAWEESGDIARSGITLLSNSELVGRWRSAGDTTEPITLYLNTRGGDAEEAFRIGRFVHKVFLKTEAPTSRKILGPVSTYLGPNPHGDTGGAELVCASSCAFIWLAGRWRAGDRVAFHRPYEVTGRASRSSAELDRSAATVSSLTKVYLQDLGVDDRIYPVIMSQSRDEAIWLEDLRGVADVPAFSLAFEEQAIDACALSASGHQKSEDAFLSLFLHQEQRLQQTHLDQVRCVEWELALLQSGAWWASLEESAVAEQWQEKRSNLLAYGAGALGIIGAVILVLRRRRRKLPV